MISRVRRMTKEEMRDKAVQLMMVKRFHCSQAVLSVGQEKLGMNDGEVIKAMGAFGGGLGGNGEVCGAIVGALAVLGLRFSRASEDEKEDPKMWSYAHEILERFQKEIVKNHGSILCGEIARVNWKDREQVRCFYKGETVLECVRIVGDTAVLVGELLERATQPKMVMLPVADE
ncbi:MAG: C-GCAxxG-C-C family protein [Syntrophales bacterium]|nr:C-GCAxxG-C-C family protein [Syntrophales bacterium]